MISNRFNYHAIEVNLYGQPVSDSDIKLQRKRLYSIHFTYLNYILAILVLGSVVTYRALSLNYDSDFELFQISSYIGLWFALFTGFIADGSGWRKLQMIFIAALICVSASLFSSMVLTLFFGKHPIWISSINVFFSALGSLWVFLYYDLVMKGFESMKRANKKQLSYIHKAVSDFDELNQFNRKIREMGRQPVVAEYWAMRDWIERRIDVSNA